MNIKPANTNLIDVLYNPDVVTSEADKVFTLKSIINALTGLTCSSLMVYINAQRRGEAMEDEIPTLDERNEKDAEIRGKEVEAEHIEEIGFVTADEPYRIACIANGIRHALYTEMESYIDLEPPTALHRTPKFSRFEKTNWSQPMSAQIYMETRVKMAKKVNPADVAKLARRKSTVEPDDLEETGDTVEDKLADQARLDRRMTMLRNSLQNAANKSSDRLSRIVPDVLAEVDSLPGGDDVDSDRIDPVTGMRYPNYQPDAFLALPVELQLRVATNISNSYDREFDRLVPLSVNNEELYGECDLIEANMKKLRRWINTTNHVQRREQQRPATLHGNGVPSYVDTTKEPQPRRENDEDITKQVVDLVERLETVDNAIEAKVEQKKKKRTRAPKAVTQ